ncbi:peroxiredoxin [Auritidibacter ignavus]|uniref:redoxin domain-containing protein n=1 Tax=Auritidibacter TaxID=1160973 RepID=UPI000D732A96|nr:MULTISPECIES: redoxin domain-containing protein [Auritidibacter]AXR73332.1 peroxiredoxin [Auritidibacter sp. NML130574]PXA79295.1 peroxiredoxin [Auritidibacter sp. NML120779]PXA82087.1 peroxiredoxin [Auritidibacter sp. NML120636]PXA76177.1 peroxiredoxin [Auritidibacter sp. NML100628]RMX24064.1 peroxiredoxin [Auritidibacter ignavus]
MSSPGALSARDQYGQRWSSPFLAPERTECSLAGVWLYFLPGAFTPVCSRELTALPTLVTQLSETRVGLRVVAVDSVAVLRVLADQLWGADDPATGSAGPIPLLSDFWPHGAIAESFQAFDPATGKPLRHSVLLDRAGVERARVTGSALQPREHTEHLRLAQEQFGETPPLG